MRAVNRHSILPADKCRASRLPNSKPFNYCHQGIRGATSQQLSDYSVTLVNRPGGVLKQDSACVYGCRQEVDVCGFLGEFQFD